MRKHLITYLMVGLITVLGISLYLVFSKSGQQRVDALVDVTSSEVIKFSTTLAGEKEVPRRELGNSKARRIDLLAGTNKPADAFAAYLMIRDCVIARRADREATEAVAQHREPSSSICGDIAPGQIASRLQLLDVSARAGVHGALYAFALEGPEGYGFDRSYVDSPSLRQWIEKIHLYQEAGAKTGDHYSLLSLSERYENDEPRSISKALSYWVAQNEVLKASASQADGSAYYSVVARLSSKLSPEEADRAIARGLEIALAVHQQEKSQ
jgi:thiamine monophosphate kinase